MSTHAQMTTIATYRIALLNNPPLAEPGHGHSVKKAECQIGTMSKATMSAGTVLPSSVPM